ncbi:protein kinase domain-containing protein, partial [Wuchereria bancrofti]
VLKQEGHSKESEAWSIGCILYCMLIGKPPFEADTLEKTYVKIASGDYSFPLKPKICTSAEDLISKLLTLDAIARIKVTAVKFHPYFGNRDIAGKHEPCSAKTKENNIFQLSKKIFDQGFGGGCSIGDSGIGSEGCLNARPRSVSDCKVLYKQLLLGYYTENEAERYLMISDTDQDPWSFFEWTTFDTINDQRLKKNDYMDKELQPVYERSNIRQHLDALVYQKRHSGVLVMFLALGTIQINFLESHEKLVISRDEHGRLLLTLIEQCVDFHTYQLLPCASTSTRANCQKVQHLLNKACRLLEGEKALLQRSYYATQC